MGFPMSPWIPLLIWFTLITYATWAASSRSP